MLNTARKLKNNQRVHIVCFGDSITANNATTENLFNYVNLLAERLDTSAMVVNAGVSGDTVIGMSNRLEREVLIFNPDLVTIMTGMNDPAFGADLQEFRNVLCHMVDRCILSGCDVAIITPNPLISHLKDIKERRSNYPNYIEVMREVAKAKNVTLCDANAEFYKLTGHDENNDFLKQYMPLMYDHIHPNHRGHQLIAETLFKALGVDK